MAGKQILGDDPFGGGGGDETPPPGVDDAKAAKAKAGGKDKLDARPKADKVSDKPKGESKRGNGNGRAQAAPPTPASEPEPARIAETAPIFTETKAKEEAAPSLPPQETYSAIESTPPSEYGPSIDRPPPSGQRHGVVEELRQIERSVRDRFLPARSEGEHGGERRRLPLEFIWQRWRKLAMRDRSESVDEFGRDAQVAAKVDPFIEFLYRSYFRVDARGLGHIPDDGRALLVGNHSGTLPYDGAMIMHAVKTEHSAHRDVRPLIEDFVFHFPYLGTLVNRIGGVRACPENAERLLNQEQLVAVFPEGIKGISKLFSERYQLQRFGRGGFIKLALKCDAPIIPTAVVGAEEIHPMISRVTWLAKSVGIPYIPVTPTFPLLGPLGMVPLPTKWVIAFGEPLYFNAEYGPEGANDRILVNKLAEQVRHKIQDMLDSLLKQRRSILFG